MSQGLDSDLLIQVAGDSALSSIAVRPGALEAVGQFLGDSLSDVSAAALLVTDENVAPLYLETVARSLMWAGIAATSFEIPAGESSKSLGMLQRLYEELARINLSRDNCLIALGGGVVSDLVGFAAATWKRGVPFVILPTTLEAAIDASIGGKTAVNLAQGKNLVGAFHLPRAVLVDPDCLETLPPREFRAGLAESVKHALIDSQEFLRWHEDNKNAILAIDADVLGDLIARNIRIKAAVVNKDPFETTGQRAILNLGHTIGHAIESRCRYQWRHGECVALGLVAMSRICVGRGMLSPCDCDRILSLLAAFGLPTTLCAPIPTADILSAIRQDKKAQAGRMRFVLLDGVGNPVLVDDVTVQEVADAYESLLP